MNGVLQSKPLVSIIIPVYNVEPYLEQCLDSVVRQSYGNLEIILIDDGSSDGSGRICDAYAEKDDRITVYHTENRGLSAARNLGIENASASYIAFLDSDDWLEEHAVNNMIESAISSCADIVCCRYCREFRGYRKTPEQQETAVVLSGSDIMRELSVGTRVANGAWNKLYKSELFEEIRYPEGRYYEDIATTYRLLCKASKVICIPEPLIHYRIRSQSIAQSHSLKNLQDYWWAYRKRYEDLSAISEECGCWMLGSCMSAIGRMWRWYAGLTKAEKKEASATLDSMHHFALEHRDEVVRNVHFSKMEKFSCMCAQTKSPLLMRCLYIVNQGYRCFRWRRQEPY